MRTAFLLILCLGFVAPSHAQPAFAAVLQDATCPECKAKIKADAKFCPGCGAKIVQQACADCKTPLKPGAKFCPNCGKKTEETPKPDPKPEPAPEPGKKPPEPQEAAKPQGKIVDADSVKAKLDE